MQTFLSRFPKEQFNFLFTTDGNIIETIFFFFTFFKKRENRCFWPGSQPCLSRCWNVFFILPFNWTQLPKLFLPIAWFKSFDRMDTSESFRPFQFPFILCGTVDCTKTVQVPASNCAETVHFSYSFVHFLYSRRRPHRQVHRLGISLCNYSNLWLLSAKGSLRLALGSPLSPSPYLLSKIK